MAGIAGKMPIDQNGSKDVVALVSGTPCAIGYSGIAFATSGVKVVKISPRQGERAIAPSEKTVIDRSYPIAPLTPRESPPVT